MVEFGHQYDVKLEHEGSTTRVVARIKAKPHNTTYKMIHELPFAALDSAEGRYRCWSLPKAGNNDEAEARGHYFWEEFVRFARGTQKKRRTEAMFALGCLMLPQMHGPEADVFMEHLVEALIDSLRVGVGE